MNNEAITESESIFRYEAPPDREKKVLLLTAGGVAIVGKWGKGSGVIAWHPLPKRNRQAEKELGR